MNCQQAVTEILVSVNAESVIVLSARDPRALSNFFVQFSRRVAKDVLSETDGIEQSKGLQDRLECARKEAEGRVDRVDGAKSVATELHDLEELGEHMRQVGGAIVID